MRDLSYSRDRHHAIAVASPGFGVRGGHGTDTWILDNELVLILAFLQHKLQSRNEYYTTFVMKFHWICKLEGGHVPNAWRRHCAIVSSRCSSYLKRKIYRVIR